MAHPFLNASPSFKSFLDTLPFSGQAGLEFFARRGLFYTPILIKLIPVQDMSLPQLNVASSFDEYLFGIRSAFKPGDPVTGMTIDGGKTVHGNLDKIDADHSNKRVKVYIRVPETAVSHEVHPDSVYARLHTTPYNTKDYIMQSITMAKRYYGK